MSNRDAAKNGQHNLGGNIKQHACFTGNYADGGSVSVPIPKLDPPAQARATAREARKPPVDDTPMGTPAGRNIFDIVRNRGNDLQSAEDRMVKPEKKADGGPITISGTVEKAGNALTRGLFGRPGQDEDDKNQAKRDADARFDKEQAENKRVANDALAKAKQEQADFDAKRKGKKFADGGKVRKFEDGGFANVPEKEKEKVSVTSTDPFKSNDDGGGGAYAARQSYEAKQAESKKAPDFKDADTLNTERAAPAPKAAAIAKTDDAVKFTDADTANSGKSTSAAPSAMPAKVTTLTEEEKEKAKPFRMTGKGKAAKHFNSMAEAVTKGYSKADDIKSGKEDVTDQTDRAKGSVPAQPSVFNADTPFKKQLLGDWANTKPRYENKNEPEKAAPKKEEAPKEKSGLTDEQKKRIDAMQRKT